MGFRPSAVTRPTRFPFLTRAVVPPKRWGTERCFVDFHLGVASNDIPKFTRIVSFAYDNFVNVLVEHQGIPGQDALTLTQALRVGGPREASSRDSPPPP